MGSTYYFVENLTPVAWAFSIWPRLIGQRIRNASPVICCYVIDGSPLTLLLAKISSFVTGVPVRKLDFRLADMQSEDGESVRWRILYGDLARVQSTAATDSSYQKFLEATSQFAHFPDFLAKKLVSAGYWNRGNLWRGIHLVRVCQWEIRKFEFENGDELHTNGGIQPVLFIEKIPWLPALEKFAGECGVSIVPVRPAMNLYSRWRQMVPSWAMSALRWARFYRITRRSNDSDLESTSSKERNSSRPKVAFDYYGQGNPDNPERHSDLHFWQQSSLDGADLLCLLQFPGFPLDEKSKAELKNHGIDSIRLHPAAATAPGIPLFQPAKTSPPAIINIGQAAERRWLNRELANYQRLKSSWTELAERENLKVYLTWYKYTADHIAIADAIETTGGVTAVYQRGYEAEPSAQNTIAADLVFGFSQKVVELERESNSKIKYHVTTGYLGDHRFPLVRDSSQKIRERLMGNGATHILAFLDENSADDPRWRPGHHLTQKDYAFLLEKVLNEPWLGLVIKPKLPRTLRRRLEEVSELLRQAEATGRCYVFEAQENAPAQGWNTPAEAALVSDITIHGDLAAATAGVESALAGVPTLLHDPLGWPTSPLYELGLGTTVFTDWESLWGACRQQWSEPQGVPGFGDWTPVLDDLDPFRDGRAAERMGAYVHWLLEGFRAGQDRETVMAEAAERYSAAWGSDKITEVNWNETAGGVSHSEN